MLRKRGLVTAGLCFSVSALAYAQNPGDVGSPQCRAVQLAAQAAVSAGGPYANHGKLVSTAAAVVSPAAASGAITPECASCIMNQFARRIPISKQQACGPNCGTGTLEAPEQCDDGNNAACDGCSPTCTKEYCGDGVLCPGEQCDDGNNAACDGCSPSCTLEFCGDGVVCPPEQCEPGDICDNGGACTDNCTCPICAESVIDADGTDSAGDGVPGAVDVQCGDPLSSFPVAGNEDAGLDWFDNDHDGQWTFGAAGDDLHSEDPNTCPGAIRDGIHQLGQDCKVLDLDGSLFTGQPVDCDLEVSFAFTEPHVSNGGCPSALNNIRYFDANGDGSWDDGEDIVLDANGNGIYDCACCPAPPTDNECDKDAPCGSSAVCTDGVCACFFTAAGNTRCFAGESQCAVLLPCISDCDCAAGSACSDTCCGLKCIPLCGAGPGAAAAEGGAGTRTSK